MGDARHDGAAYFDTRHSGLGTDGETIIMSTFKVFGACNTTNRRVFKVKFSQPLSSVPSVRAYDNDQTFPNAGNLTTANFHIFTGVTANSFKPLLRFHDTTRAGAPVTYWYTLSTLKATGTYNCMMRGNDSYLTFRISTASMAVVNASVYWNAAILTPYSVYPTMDRLHDIAVRYTFTGDSPVVSFYANNYTAGGNDATAVWGTIIEGSRGVRFGSATATNTSILANIPISGQEVSRSSWVTGT